MATFNVILWKYHVDKKGRAPLKIRVNSGNTQGYESLGVRILEQDWDSDKAQVKRSHPNYREINHKISKTLAHLQSEALSLDNPTASEILGSSSQGKDNFFTYASKIMQGYDKEQQYNTIRAYEKSFDTLKKHYGADLKLRSINYQLMQGLKAQFIKEGLSPSTIKLRMSPIIIIYNKAKAEGLVQSKDNPFRDLHIKKNPKKKERLTLEELQKLRNFTFSKKNHAQARDAFMLSFNIRGIRPSDVVKLSNDNIKDGRIEIVTQKDKEAISCELTQEALSIINRNNKSGYIFSFLHDGRVSKKDIGMAVTIYGKQLTEACKVAGIEKHVTPHVARHTWAQLAMEMNVSPAMIQDSLGHSDLATTQNYLDGFAKAEKDSINRLVTSRDRITQPSS